MREPYAGNVAWVYQQKLRILIGIYAIFGVLLIAAMLFVVVMLRASLLKDSQQKTRELAGAIHYTLGSLMLQRNPGTIQATLERIVQGEGSTITRAFVLDAEGRIVYSSDPAETGRSLDRHSDASCTPCHTASEGVTPSEHTITIEASSGGAVHRNVRVIYNEPRCFGCHPEGTRINGKVIIDRSLSGTASLILFVELIILGSGLVCLAISYPFLNRSVDKYIGEIVRQSSELMLLYMMVERLSKTIDLAELREIVAEIVRDTFGAERVDIVLTSEGGSYSSYSMEGAGGFLRRKNVGEDKPLEDLMRRWLRYEITAEGLSPDNKTLYIPVGREGHQVALIVARRERGSFGPIGLEVLRVISGHIATALENAKLYVMAITDDLTGLYSYRHFTHSVNKHLDRHKAHGQRFTLLMLDLDAFKGVNDRHGHEAGNEVLRDVARELVRATRDSDQLFRYGGEEFAVILPATGIEGGMLVAERIRRNVETAIFIKGRLDLRLTISIGLATYPAHAGDAEGLIKSADDALYQAKRDGRNRVQTGPAPNARTIDPV